jgi:plasmid stabilization system protein ParE
MYTIEVSEQAERDLTELFVWIFEEKGMPDTALHYIQAIYNKIKRLELYPTVRPIERNRAIIMQYGFGVRKLNYKKMSVLYTVNEETATVDIIRVIAGSMIR